MTKPRSMPLARNPGGRPRRRRHRDSAFSRWLEAGRHGLTVEAIAKRLRISKVSVYALRDGRFNPGRELALAIAALSGGRVPVDSWPARSRRRMPAAAADADPEGEPELGPAGLEAHDNALTLAFLLFDQLATRKARIAALNEAEREQTAGRWATELEALHAAGATWGEIQHAIFHSTAPGSSLRSKINSAASLVRWWPDIRRAAA